MTDQIKSSIEYNVVTYHREMVLKAYLGWFLSNLTKDHVNRVFALPTQGWVPEGKDFTKSKELIFKSGYVLDDEDNAIALEYRLQSNSFYFLMTTEFNGDDFKNIVREMLSSKAIVGVFVTHIDIQIKEKEIIITAPLIQTLLKSLF